MTATTTQTRASRKNEFERHKYKICYMHSNYKSSFLPTKKIACHHLNMINKIDLNIFDGIEWKIPKFMDWNYENVQIWLEHINYVLDETTKPIKSRELENEQRTSMRFDLLLIQKKKTSIIFGVKFHLNHFSVLFLFLSKKYKYFLSTKDRPNSSCSCSMCLTPPSFFSHSFLEKKTETVA